MQHAKKRVVISGMGVITSLGVGVKKNWESLLSGKSGMRSLRHMPEMQKYKCQVGATICDEFDYKPHVTSFGDSKLFTLTNAIVKEALADANIDTNNMPTIDRERFGVGVASMTASLNAATQQFPTNNASSAALCTERVYYLPCSIAFNHKLHGQTFTILNACAAGTVAVGDAYRLVKNGAMDVMVAGACDFNVNPYAYRFMEKLGALRTTSNDNPEDVLCSFDAERDGTSLADGGAILIVESLESALKRNAKIYCEITGYGANCYGTHICSPNPDGVGNFKALKQALLDANITPDKVDLVNSHATSTKIGDKAEAMALKKMFYNKKTHSDIEALRAVDPLKIELDDLSPNVAKRTAITAHKGVFGHTQTSSGAIEIVYSILQMQNKTLIPIKNLKNPCDPDMNFAMNSNKQYDINCFVKNGVGFGSQYAAVVFERYQEK